MFKFNVSNFFSIKRIIYTLILAFSENDNIRTLIETHKPNSFLFRKIKENNKVRLDATI